MRKFTFAAALAAIIPVSGTAQEAGPLQIDTAKGTISFGARVAKFDQYEQLKGAIEYLVVMPGGKEYESIFVAPIDPVALYEGLKKLGLQPGKSGSNEEKTPPEGGRLRIWVEWKEGEKNRREPAETFVLDVLSGKPMDRKPWVFTGSREVFNPAEGKMTLGVLNTKNVIALYHNDATVLVQPSELAKDPHQFKVHKPACPREGTPVVIILEAIK
ncbi:MAG: YdjY domain-containing protein [Planctomycetota bacterium]